ncbi:MAG: thioredoxin domain-containing protein [bacterium]
MDLKLFTYADQIVDALRDFNEKPSSEGLDEGILKETYELLAQFYDKQSGGFGSAPKFPAPHNILFLLRYWKRTGIDAPLKMAEKTLRAMRQGGIYDHIGFGFHRYSTDSGWLLPHFEKMLYDQALLTMAYTEAYQVTKNKEYSQTAYEILTYVLREMTAPEGGFYSAEDADSEGEEGKFFLWTYDEVLQVLHKEEADLIIRIFNLSPEGNFREGGPNHKITYNNIFHMGKTLHEMASDMGMSLKELGGRVEEARKKLFVFRENRVHPYKDDKILTDWNGLMIAALARAGRVFDEPAYREAAICAADFIMANMSTPAGLLLHRYRDGQAEITGYLDDYAFFIWGLLELFESTFEAVYLKHALKLQNDLEKHFWDRSGGGFFFTPDISEDLFVRQKELYDGAVPAGNSVSVLNLLRLAHITANPRFLEQAAAIGRIFSKKAKENPVGYTQFMVAMDFAFGPSFEVFVAGSSLSDDTKEMLRSLQTNFIPNAMVIFRPAEQKVSYIDEISPFMRYCKSIGDKATAYVCQNNACNKPTTDVDELLEMLNVRSCRDQQRKDL